MTATATEVTPARFFYGRWIVLGAILGQFISVSVNVGSAGVLLDPITEDFGWSRAQFTIATAGASAVGGIAGFFIGPMVDRHGARRLMVAGSALLIGTLLLASRITELWQFVLLEWFGLGLGFSLVGPLVVNITLSKWFVTGRGWAISIGSIGISLASVITPLVMTRVVDSSGWRDGFLVLAGAVAIVALPVALIMRRQPEDYGLLPDGVPADGHGVSAAASQATRLDALNSYTRAEALRTPAIWLLTITVGCFGAGTTSVLFHGIPFSTDAGFTRTEAALAIAAAGVTNLISKFAWGYTLSRFHVRTLWAGCFGLLAVGVILMLLADASDFFPLLIGAFLLWGFGFGGGIPLSEFIWAKYYGRVHIGAVRGVGMPFSIIFGAIAPISVALVADASGRYIGAWLGLAVVYLVGAAAVLMSREPPPKVLASELDEG